MTKDEVIRLSLNAMLASLPRLAPYGEKDWLDSKAAIKACKEVLAQPEPEPVAWILDADLAILKRQSEQRSILAWNSRPNWLDRHNFNEVLKAVPLYTHPKE